MSFLPCLFVLFKYFETVQFLKVLLNDSILFVCLGRSLVARVTVPTRDAVERHNDELGDM